MRKAAVIKASLFVLSFIFFVLQAGYSAETYKIGAVVSITGPASFLGDPERKSIELLRDEINEKGGVRGHKIELIIHDDASEETKAVMATKRLIEYDKVLAIVGPSISGISLAMIPFVEKGEIPNISCAASAKITQPAIKWVYSTAYPDFLDVRKMFKYLKKKNITKIAAINSADGYGISGWEQIQAQGPKAGFEIVIHETYGPNDNDMTPQLTRIKQTNAQAVLNWNATPASSILAKNFRQLGMTQELLMATGFGNIRFLKLAGPAANGIIMPNLKSIIPDQLHNNDPQKAVIMKYVKDYEARFKSEPNVFGGLAFDALNIICKALEKSGANRARLRDEIEKTKNYVGVTGIFNLSPTDHLGLTEDAAVVMGVKDEKWILIEY